MMNHHIAISILLGAACACAQEQSYVSAKKLFYADAAPDKVPVTKVKGPVHGVKTVPTAYSVAGLRYAVLQELEPGKEVTVDPAKEFRTGDKVRFEFESNVEGYLYVTQEGSSGKWNVLFPDQRINNGTNHVQKRTPYSIPARSKYFVFNEVPGDEKLMVFLCKTPVNGLPAEAKQTPQTLDQKVINELNSSLRSRDLVFEKDDEGTISPITKVPTASTYVVNKNENGQAVVVTIHLKHVR